MCKTGFTPDGVRCGKIPVWTEKRHCGGRGGGRGTKPLKKKKKKKNHEHKLEFMTGSDTDQRSRTA